MLNIVQTAFEAGKAVMDIYETDLEIEYKADNSPLTKADKRSHDIIENNLQTDYPDIPILSEEGKQLHYKKRSKWETFWLVDPIDGTKEFIKKNGEFTVNIALIEQGSPVFGVIYAPAMDIMYVGEKGKGSFKMSKASDIVLAVQTEEELLMAAEKLPLEVHAKKNHIVASRSHRSPATKALIRNLKSKHTSVEMMAVGSSLKLCYVAEGKADYYPRYAPTMEWDTAAGQAIVEQAGGQVQIYESQKSLTYNKENLKNPWFLAKR